MDVAGARGGCRECRCWRCVAVERPACLLAVAHVWCTGTPSTAATAASVKTGIALMRIDCEGLAMTVMLDPGAAPAEGLVATISDASAARTCWLA